MSHKHRDRSYPPLPEALPSPVADDHTHIELGDQLLGDEQELALDEQVARAAAVGVTRIVQCGCDIDSARWTATEATTNPAVVGAIGIHPNTAARLLAGQPTEDADEESSAP